MNNFHGLAFLAGLLLPLQVAFNNKLTSVSGNPTTSSLVSFSVGTIALLIYSVFGQVSFQKSFLPLGHAPWYAWIGGLVGALYIISTVVASPRIGIVVFLIIVILGQLTTSALLEHFGWLGTPLKPFNWLKGIGVVLVLSGVLLLKK